MQLHDSLTDAQDELIGDLDDVAEHVAWEFDADEYEGISACGFAHIGNISGNGSFVKRVKSLSQSDAVSWVSERQNGGYRIVIGRLDLSLRKAHDSGYRLSITNTQDLAHGASYQRMDVQERLHDLVLERLRYHGYCENARRKSRMD